MMKTIRKLNEHEIAMVRPLWHRLQEANAEAGFVAEMHELAKRRALEAHHALQCMTGLLAGEIRGGIRLDPETWELQEILVPAAGTPPPAPRTARHEGERGG